LITPALCILSTACEPSRYQVAIIKIKMWPQAFSLRLHRRDACATKKNWEKIFD
jgi:hypothetical protein